MAAEDEARSARRGLWQGEFLYPWDFRHGTGGPVTAETAGPLPAAAAAGEPQPSVTSGGSSAGAAAAPSPADSVTDVDSDAWEVAEAAEVTVPTAGATGGGADPACAIKGNIGRSGSRIYHVPGSPSYDGTQIDEAKGERWFCSEAEAQAAGWRAPGARRRRR